MTRQRFTLADLSLEQQAQALGVPANQVAAGNTYKTRKDEQQEQIWFMEWCQTQTVSISRPDGQPYRKSLFEAFIAYPGGAFLAGDGKRRAMQWGIMEKMGAKAGVSDLQLPWPANGYHGMWLEMKKRREQFRCSSDVARAVRTDQTAFLEDMRRLGHFTAVAFGWIEAAKKTCLYLGWDPAERGVS